LKKFLEKFYGKGVLYKGVNVCIYNKNIVMGQRLVITEEERKIILEQNRKKPWTPSQMFLSKSDDQVLSDLEKTIEEVFGWKKNSDLKYGNLKNVIEMALSLEYNGFEFKHRDEVEFKRIVNDLTNKFKSRAKSKTGVVYDEEFSHNDILQRITDLIPRKEEILKKIIDSLSFDLKDDGMSKDDVEKLIPKYTEYIRTKVKNLFKE